MSIAFAFSMYYWREATPTRLVKTALSALVLRAGRRWHRRLAGRRNCTVAVRSQAAEEKSVPLAEGRSTAEGAGGRGGRRSCFRRTCVALRRAHSVAAALRCAPRRSVARGTSAHSRSSLASPLAGRALLDAGSISSDDLRSLLDVGIGSFRFVRLVRCQRCERVASERTETRRVYASSRVVGRMPATSASA